MQSPVVIRLHQALALLGVPEADLPVIPAAATTPSQEKAFSLSGQDCPDNVAAIFANVS